MNTTVGVCTELPSSGAIPSAKCPAARERWYLSEGVILPLQCLALFLIIAGYRFTLVGLYGTDLPYWDQWGTEGQQLIKRYFEGTLEFSHWFAPSNEHRVFFTRLLALGLTLINDQWDARVEMLANAVICSLTACGLFWYFARDFKQVQRWFWFSSVAVVFTFPFGWENTISGFQSCFYLLVAFSVIAIGCLCLFPAFSARWFIGVTAALCSLVTMASGLLAVLAVAALLGILLIRDRKEWRTGLKRDFPTFIACAFVAAVGFALMVRLEGHYKYQSHSIAQFMEAFSACLAWPYLGQNWWSLVNWLPFATLLALSVAGFSKFGRSERLVLGLGVWVFLQSAATAFSRATIVYTSRYFDILSYGLLVNFLCILILLRAIRPAWNYVLVIPFALVWLVINGQNLYSISYNGATGGKKNIYNIEAANTGAYIATRDFNFLVPKRDIKEIPFPVPELYAKILDDPVIRPLLPTSVRAALPLMAVKGNLTPTRNNLAPLDSSLHTGDQIWRVPPFEAFEAVTRKRSGLPFVVFHVAGSIENLSVIDGNRRAHSVIQLPTGGDGTWTPVYAYCPGNEVHISGRGGTAISAFTEPREAGRLSLPGLYAHAGGQKMFWSGMAGSGIALLLSAVGWHVARKAAKTVTARQYFLSADEKETND